MSDGGEEPSAKCQEGMFYSQITEIGFKVFYCNDIKMN